MKNKITFIVFSFLFCVVNGQVKTYHTNGTVKETGAYNDQGKKTGDWISYYPSGNIYSINTWKDNNRDWALFYDNEHLRESGSYTNAHKTGEWLKYDNKGCLTSIGTLKDGAYTGELRKYHMGKLSAIEQYKDQKKTGKWLWYRDGDRLHKEQNYVAGEAHGEHKSFFKNGNPIYIRFYENGKPIGTHKEYYEAGAIKITTAYEDGKKTEKRDYYENGQESHIRFFYADKSLSKGFYENGQLGHIGYENFMENGQYIGLWKYYHENGKLHYKGNHEEGERVGKWKGWYANGKRKFKGKYIADEKVGEWKYYNEKGKLKNE